ADLDLTPDDPFCMQHHYLNFRGRLHYGRNWYHLFRGQNYTPLLSPKLSRAAFSLPVADYKASKPSMDILAALDNTLAVIPFELDDKFFSSRLLEASPFWGDPVDFSKIHIPAKRVFGREPELEQADLAEREGTHLANAFRMALKSNFDRYLPEVRAANFLEAGYLQGAVEDAETLTGRPEKWRRVAHIVHLGHFMELGVQVS
ncbi:hypothetical protein, partial [Glycocaulis sp.]|uniref:hypothetical protein n=1 Tax=Glycocaulis sp. TaxID=1969725 RepID=UPI0025C5F3DC